MLTVEDAGRRVEGRWLWRRVAFDLAAGESLGIAGPSGSGKTLLFRSLVGLDRLDEGRVGLDGRAYAEWPPPRFRAAVLYLPQSPSFAEGRVEDALRAPFDYAVHRRERYDRSRALELLERFELGEAFLERGGADLSGGERGVVAFVRALLLSPRVLVLDEPTAHLDPQRARALEELVEAWRGGGEGGDGGRRGTLWTSHDAEQLARVTDRRLDLTRFKPADEAEAPRSGEEEG